MKTNLRRITYTAPCDLARVLRSVFARTGIHVAWLVLLTFPVAGRAQNPVDWTVGDVFAGVGGGNYQVWHSANPAAKNPSYTQVLPPINDGTTLATPGLTAGCAFDSAYRPFTTNFSNNDVVRFTIDDAHGTVSGSGTNFPIHSTANTGAHSVAFDGHGNFYVGYATGGLEKYSHDGTLLTCGPPLSTHPCSFAILGGVEWLDVANDGNTVFYTSGGRTIFTFDTSASAPAPQVYADLSLVSNAGPGPLGAIRILPPGDGTGGVLVADTSNVKLVTVSGGVVSFQKFAISGESNLQALSLDPLFPSVFWAGDATSGDVVRFDTSKKQKPVTLPTGAGTALGGICVDGSLSAAQLAFAPPPATQTFSLTPTANTVFFTSPFTGTVFTATLADLTSNTTATLRDSLVDPSVAESDPTVFSLNPGNPNFGTPIAGNMPCDQTLTGLTGHPNTCEVFELETNPNSGFTTTDLEINKRVDLVESTPNLRVLRNEDDDITDGVINYPTSGTKTTGTKSCVFTVNGQTSNSNFEICGGGFSSPAQGAFFTKNQTSTITFKFKVSPTGTCPSGSSPPPCPSSGPCLTPLLLIVQTFPPDPVTGIVPAPVSVNVIVAGNSGGPPVFVLSGNTWQLQVKTTDMPAGFTYIATMIDLASTIPSISTTFALN